MTGVSVNIFRSGLGDCTNRGVTCPDLSIDSGLIFVLFDEEIKGGNYDLEECLAKPERYVCLKIVRRRLGRPNEYLHVEPFNQPEGKAGPMAGGNFVYSSDSRFPHDYPLAVHDRFETWEQYDQLTR